MDRFFIRRHWFLFGLLLCHWHVAEGQGFLLKHFTVRDGLANATVYHAVQDDDGFIWFATPTGISKFDGKRFRNFTKVDGLVDNDVFKFAKDSQGRIWLFGFNSKLCYYKNGRFYSELTNSQLAYKTDGSYIYEAFEDKLKRMWFLNEDRRVIFYDGQGITVNKLGTQPIGLHYFLQNDQLFNACSKSLRIVSMYDSTDTFSRNALSKIHVITPPSFYKNEPLLNELKNHTMILTQKNIYCYTHIGLTCFFRAPDFGVEGYLLCSFIDGNDLWVGTDKALYVLKNYFSGKYSLQKIIGDVAVSSIMKDKEDNYWFTTLGEGAYSLPKRNFYFTYYNRKNSLSDNIVQCLFLDPVNKSLYIGLRNGILDELDSNNVLHHYAVGLHTEVKRIKKIIPYDRENLLVCFDNFIYIFNKHLHRFKIFKKEIISDYAVASDGTLKLATRHYVYQYANGTVRSFFPFQQVITAMAVAGKDSYYLGTTHSILLVQKDSVITNLGEKNPLFQFSVSDLLYVNGCLWVATAEKGIYILRENQFFKILNTKNGLIGDICQQLYFNGRNKVYVATTRGLSVIDVANFKVVNNITTSDGLLSDDVKDVIVRHDTLYAATAEGLCIFKESGIFSDTLPPKVYFTEVSYNNHMQLVHDTLVYTYTYADNSSFEVLFNAITFDLPDQVRYQCALVREGAAPTNWIAPPSNSIQWYGLAPGEYQLWVRAKKYKSDWGKPVILSFTIRPRWYQQNWTKWLGVFVILLGFLIGINVYIRWIRKRERQRADYTSRLLELESRALTSQMTPHFIYNSLSAVQHFILKKEEQKAFDYLSDFSLLMRQMLNNSRKSYVSLEDEVSFLSRYLELEKMRFSWTFEYQFYLDPVLKENDFCIPPMIIQPILENAVKHGLAPKKGEGRLKVSLILADDMIQCQVEDNGIGWEKSLSGKANSPIRHESAALSVIRERLNIIRSYKGNIGSIEIIDKQAAGYNSEGTIVNLLIPIINAL